MAGGSAALAARRASEASWLRFESGSTGSVGRISLTAAFVPPVQAGHDAMQPRPWLAVQSYAAYRESALDRIHSVIHWNEDELEYDTHRAVAALAGSRVKLTVHVRAYGPTRPEQLVRLAEAVHRARGREPGMLLL